MPLKIAYQIAADVPDPPDPICLSISYCAACGMCSYLCRVPNKSPFAIPNRFFLEKFPLNDYSVTAAENPKSLVVFSRWPKIVWPNALRPMSDDSINDRADSTDCTRHRLPVAAVAMAWDI